MFSKFSEIMTKIPTLYVGTKAEEDTDTQALIYDWYQFRECGDEDDKFQVYFRRSINRGYPRFKMLLELELQEIPELADYKEHIAKQFKGNTSITEAVNNVVSFVGEDTGSVQSTATSTLDEDSTSNKSGTDTDSVTTQNTLRSTGTDTIESSETGTDNVAHSGTDTMTRTGTVTDAQTADAKHVEVSRGLPQSNSYAGAAAGAIPSLDWSTATSQYQSSDNGGTNQQTNNLTDTETIATSDNRTLNISNDSVETRNLQDSSNGTSAGTTTYNSGITGTVDSTSNSTGSENSTLNSETTTTTEGNKRKTGEDHNAETIDTVRANVFETELKDKVWDYILTSDAFKYFCRVWLDQCFFGIYR